MQKQYIIEYSNKIAKYLTLIVIYYEQLDVLYLAQ